MQQWDKENTRTLNRERWCFLSSVIERELPVCYIVSVMQSFIKKILDDNQQVTSMGQESLTGFKPMTSYCKPSEANLHNEVGQLPCCH